jgi:1-pyrroline-5-carboxylate dehydrogenase
MSQIKNILKNGNFIARNLAPKFKRTDKITSKVYKEIKNYKNNINCIPAIINGHEYNTYSYNYINSPYDNKQYVSKNHDLSIDYLISSLNEYKDYKKKWNEWPIEDRMEIFLKAADLIENKYYNQMLAATIYNQNKTIYEAEIDAICELVDFLRFNVYYCQEILKKQPISPEPGIQNISEYKPLNGFICSVTPFNFTAIGGNLATLPILFGNVVYWKPSEKSLLSNLLFYNILKEAGLPDGVVNFVPMDGEKFINTVTNHIDFGGLLYTGSSNVFDGILKKTYQNMCRYKSYPRIIGETGGKNFHFVEKSMCLNDEDLDFIAQKTFESAFDFSGQKCSACSRLYFPKKYWLRFQEIMIQKYLDFKEENFNYGLIDEKSYFKTMRNLDLISSNDNNQFIFGGEGHNINNYYIKPTLVLAKNHDSFLFKQEFFAPILGVYLYDSDNINITMEKCLNSAQYGLTGAIFSRNEKWIHYAKDYLSPITGNFYINDKSTGSVVGQQPFGGGLKSGTNDKAGDYNILYRLFNQRNIKVNTNI